MNKPIGQNMEDAPIRIEGKCLHNLLAVLQGRTTEDLAAIEVRQVEGRTRIDLILNSSDDSEVFRG